MVSYGNHILPAVLRRIFVGLGLSSILICSSNQRHAATSLQDGEITPSLRSDGLLSTNIRQRYKVPSIAKHIYQDSRHVCDSTDDIADIYEIVFLSLRKSVA